MSDYSKDFTDELNEVEKSFNRQPYPYYEQINSVSNMRKTILKHGLATSPYEADQLAIQSYPSFLVDGGGLGSKIPGPLGDKYFARTGSKCTDVTTHTLKDRSIYINNVPDGSIPFIPSFFDTHFTQYEGLIPSAIGNLSRLHPFKIVQAFLEGSNPKCIPITLETIDMCNNKAKETKYLTNTDVMAMDPCWFPGSFNPLTNQRKKNCGFDSGPEFGEVQTGNHCHVKDQFAESQPLHVTCSSLRASDKCATNKYCAWTDQGISFSTPPITNCMPKTKKDISYQSVCVKLTDPSNCNLRDYCTWVDFNIYTEYTADISKSDLHHAK